MVLHYKIACLYKFEKVIYERHYFSWWIWYTPLPSDSFNLEATAPNI